MSIERGFEEYSVSVSDSTSSLPSPLFLSFICFVLLMSGMSFLSRPIKLRCCQCWIDGVPPVWLVILGLAVVQLGFGGYPVVIKKFADSKESKADPLILSFYRDLCCFPVLFLCAFVAERKVMIPSLKMLFWFAVFGLLGMFGNQYLFILGVYKAGPNVASVFQPLIPVWTAVIVWLTCTERAKPAGVAFWIKLFGILLAAGGAIEITVTGERSSGGTDEDRFQRILGYLFLFGNTLCMSVYVWLQKRFVFGDKNNKWREYPVFVTAYSYFFGAVFMGLCSLQNVVSEEKREKFTIPRPSVYVLVYATFITSALCYLLITWANSQVSSILVTASWPLQVLIAVLGSWLFLNIKFLYLQYLGAAMLILGLVFVLLANYQEERERKGKGGFIGRINLLKCCIDQTCNDGGEDTDPLLGSVNSIPSAPSPLYEKEEKKPLDSTPLSTSDDERKIN
ncbi:PREDICTED: WAT1-related protein At5g45370-like [Amphimedon queenslandica]|uniref:EamA domain-containing protein n=1 Tax=Amphimedon queenslandica TaxID=400682 RepID=A0A1X7UNP1_AMPQE|nr:PREDICTED: WAT1-related protein At5g45370-like [Amphimedon queenslandica]|eukprot:XP_003387276.1 PREDICTED: WAT1-related protein At5g45370-like [Amphimedon queenslandica]